VHAACPRVTIVGRAYFVVIAVVHLVVDATAIFTVVSQGAWISVVAGVVVVGRVLAPCLRVASIRGARVVVVAIDGGAGLAFAVCAHVRSGAHIPVIARPVPRNMLAAPVGQTAILGARVFIVAIGNPAAHARPVLAVISIGAIVVIVALPLPGGVGASVFRVAAVIGARV